MIIVRCPTCGAHEGMFDGGDVVCMLCGKVCEDWHEMNNEISEEDE